MFKNGCPPGSILRGFRDGAPNVTTGFDSLPALRPGDLCRLPASFFPGHLTREVESEGPAPGPGGE